MERFVWLSLFKKLFILYSILLLVSIWLNYPREARADDENEYTVKTEKNLRFQVPQDWPIEERNGVIGPIPIEEYLSRKFADVNVQLTSLNQQMNLLEARLQKTENQLREKKQQVSQPAISS